MWNSSRRVALVSAGCILLGVAGVGFAWLTDRLPVRVGEAETGSLVDAPEDAIAWPDQQSEGLALTSFTPSESFAQAADAVRFDQSEPESESFSKPAESVPGEFANHGHLLTETTPARSVPLGQAIAGDDSGTGLSMPAQFPDRESRSKPRMAANTPASDARMNLDTPPHQVIRQAAFVDDAPPANPRQRADVFGSDQPLSVRQSREFPSEVRVVPPRGREAVPSERLFAQGPEPAIPTSNKSGAQESDTNGSPASASSAPGSPAPVTTVARGDASASETAVPTPGGSTAMPTLAGIDAAIKAGDIVTAHRDLSHLYWHQPEQRSVIRDRINQTATTIYFSPTPHFIEPHAVASGELMQTIAPKYQISWQYLAMLNRIDPRRLQAGRKLKVVKGPFSAFVDLSDFELTIHHHGFFVRSYAICIGKAGATPTGRFKVLDKIPNPQYTDPDGKVLAGGDPLNPLGTHWIDLGDSYGIHGTIEPASIGKAESRGCVRLLNEEVAEVYSFLIKGSEVVIRQ